MPCGKSFWTRINLLRQNCSHPPANAFLIDFGVILRSKISILRVKARRKMRKCIAVGQFGSTPVRLTTIDTYRCKIQVSATLVSYGFEQFKAHTTSSPILTYCFQGKTYTTACAEIFSQRYVLKHYEQGKAYTAYLCEKNPSFIKLKRGIRPFDLGLFLLGLAIMALSIITIFTA